jgi:hypothetical protein
MLRIVEQLMGLLRVVGHGFDFEGSRRSLRDDVVSVEQGSFSFFWSLESQVDVLHSVGHWVEENLHFFPFNLVV